MQSIFTYFHHQNLGYLDIHSFFMGIYTTYLVPDRDDPQKVLGFTHLSVLQLTCLLKQKTAPLHSCRCQDVSCKVVPQFGIAKLVQISPITMVFVGDISN